MQFLNLPIEIRSIVYNNLNVGNLKTMLAVNSIEREIVKPIFKKKTILTPRETFNSSTCTAFLLTKDISLPSTKMWSSNMCNIYSDGIKDLGIPVIFIGRFNNNSCKLFFYDTGGCLQHHEDYYILDRFMFDRNFHKIGINIRDFLLGKIKEKVDHNNYLLYGIKID